jgi:hypothetical protein
MVEVLVVIMIWSTKYFLGSVKIVLLFLATQITLFSFALFPLKCTFYLNKALTLIEMMEVNNFLYRTSMLW